MLDVRGAGGGVVTSKGDRMFFTSRDHRHDAGLAAGRTDEVPGAAHRWRGSHERRSALAPDDSFVVVSRDVGGEENPGLYLLIADGGAARGRAAHAEGADVRSQFVSDDSKSLYFRANDVEPGVVRDLSLRRRDREARARVRRRRACGRSPITSGDARGCWSRSSAARSSEIYEYDLKRRRSSTPLLGQGEVEEYDVAYGAKPGQILVRTNKLGDFHRLYTLEARQARRRSRPS